MLSQLCTSCFEHLPGSFCSVGEGKGHNFIESWEFDLAMVSVLNHGLQDRLISHVVEYDQRSIDTTNCVVSDSRFDRGHPRVLDTRCHGGEDRAGLDEIERLATKKKVEEMKGTISAWKLGEKRK